MSKDRGLNIMGDDNFDSLANPSGSAKEIDTSSSSESVIDPKTISAATAAEQNHKLKIDAVQLIDETSQHFKGKKLEEDEDNDEEDEDEDNEPEAEVKTPNDDDEDQTFRVLGKHFSDEGILDGFDDEMENTPEALQSMVKQTVERGIEKYKDSFKHPMAKEFLDYIENGGDPGSFVNMVSGPDYSSISTDQIEGNTAIQKQLLRDQMSMNGDSQEDIEDTIQAFEDAGQLEKRSTAALGKLQAARAKGIADKLTAQKESNAEKQKQNLRILDDLKEKINSTEEIGGFTLTKKIKNDFYDYITKVDSKTGKTGLMADSTDPQNQLLMSYLYYNKFNFDKLEKKSKTTATKTLQEQLGRFSDSSAKQKSRKRTESAKDAPGKLNFGPMKKLFG